jgi:hypothetical protein
MPSSIYAVRMPFLRSDNEICYKNESIVLYWVGAV